MRIDKYLWAVRLYKTRSLAAEACKKGRALLNGNSVKPSRAIACGDIIKIKRPPIWLSFKVKELLANRVGAKLVENYLEDITPPEQHAELEMLKMTKTGLRERGAGRPTKKERRELDHYRNGFLD